MITIIIADSFKRGMKSKGCPGLIPYNKKTNLFQQQCSAVRSIFPKSDILYVYGYDSKRFSGFVENSPQPNTRYILNPEHPIYSHGHSLYLARDKISQSDECLILLGYDPILPKEIGVAKKHKKSSAIIDLKKKSKLGCILDKETRSINHIFFDLDNHISNIYFLKQPEITILKDLLEHDNVHNMFLFEIMNNIISRHGKLEGLALAN